jgi:hypothetical protein
MPGEPKPISHPKEFPMRSHAALLLAAVLALSACNDSNPLATVAPVATSRAYNGTASVGDFLKITVDASAHTIAYRNLSNGDSGTVPYTVNGDGTYALNDPQGNLVAAYEIPDYAMVIQAAKTGPTRSTPALITAVNAGPISLATFGNHAYNYMQFRTAAGGLEVGSVSVGASGAASNSSYWPFGALSASNGGQSPFHSGAIDLTQAVQDPSGTFLTAASGSESDYIFGTASGVFAVDTPNGAIFGLAKAASKNFDPAFAGSYKAIFYRKLGASTGVGNVESGTPGLGSAIMTIGSLGQMTLTDSTGTVMAQGTLLAVADASYLYGGAGLLADPCNGLFTVRITVGSVQQDVFVSFLNRSAVFSSFAAALPSTPNETYDYFYGVGLK